MTDLDDLIKRLRSRSDVHTDPIYGEAADALQALQGALTFTLPYAVHNTPPHSPWIDHVVAARRALSGNKGE